MQRAALGSLVGAGLVLAAAWWTSAGATTSSRFPLEGGGQELITLTSPVDDHRQQITVIDPRMRVMSVYHVQRDTGEIALKSVRNIHWDLQMVQFNGVNPLPREIRLLLEQE